ncbi:MAG: hypothetical protein ABIJ82_03820 [Patescibacteria group bacterium]
MLVYKYNYRWDLQNANWTIRKRRWFEEHNIVVFYPSILRWFWLMFWILVSKKPSVAVKESITCYWLSSGPWGAYHPDKNAVSICPWMIKDAPGGLEGVIKHEIAHLNHLEADTMDSHEEKEKYIEKYS